MTTEYSGFKIPVARYNEFRKTLSDCNGVIGYAYTNSLGLVCVSFSFEENEDCDEYLRRWNLINTPISEKRRDSAWRRCLRRLKLSAIEKRLPVKGGRHG